MRYARGVWRCVLVAGLVAVLLSLSMLSATPMLERGDLATQIETLKQQRLNLCGQLAILDMDNVPNCSGGFNHSTERATYQEVLDFLAVDETDKNIAELGKYNCISYSLDLIGNAEEAGLRAGFVWISWPIDGLHVIVAFDTTDRGVVFVEPRTDQVVELAVGEIYEGWPWAEITGYSIIW